MKNKNFDLTDIKNSITTMYVGHALLSKDFFHFMDEEVVRNFLIDAEKMFESSNAVLSFFEELDKNKNEK